MSCPVLPPTARTHLHALYSYTQANRFAVQTGYSVALFSVGGTFTEQPDAADAQHSIATVRTKDGSLCGEDDFKVAVLKYATGGVASQLIGRGEIIKFVSQRGVKAMADMYAQANQEASA